MTDVPAHRPRWRHLGWSLPPAAAGAVAAWHAAGFTSPETSVSDRTVPFLVVSGLAMGVGFLSPWHRSAHVRLTVAAVVFLSWVAWHALWMTLALAT